MAIKTKTDISSVVDEMSAQELRSLIDHANGKLRDKMEFAKQSLVAEMREKAAELGLRFEDLLPNVRVESRQTKKRGSVAIRYYNPSTGDTSTGRGKMKAWLKAYKDGGGDINDFLVKDLSQIPVLSVE